MGLGFMLKIWIKQKAFAGCPLHFAFHFFKLLWLACNWVHKSRGLAPFLFTGWQENIFLIDWQHCGKVVHQADPELHHNHSYILINP